MRILSRALCMCLTGGLLLSAPFSAQAEKMTAKKYFSFEAADKNGNGFVEETELRDYVVTLFASIDKNMNKILDKSEAENPDSDAFKKLDADGDGKITSNEVFQMALSHFKIADLNKDHKLSKKEVAKFDGQG